ncbi:hypothetical protein AB0C18_07135 [Nonomuraea muscovyensis]|uniref:hypothetical protein n=1 Tax=Nonomuraea muscovyensis TaxID=1124761 RepID=UPI003401C925
MAVSHWFLGTDACVGRHVPAARDVEVLIDWIPETARTDRVRVRDHTCSCAPVSYELCQAGGLRFIRRTTVQPGDLQIMESPRAHATAVDDLWQLLVAGKAR